MEAVDVRTWDGYPRKKNVDKNDPLVSEVKGKNNQSQDDSDDEDDNEILPWTAKVKNVVLSYAPTLVIIIVIVKICEWLLMEAIADEVRF